MHTKSLESLVWSQMLFLLRGNETQAGCGCWRTEVRKGCLEPRCFDSLAGVKWYSQGPQWQRVICYKLLAPSESLWLGFFMNRETSHVSSLPPWASLASPLIRKEAPPDHFTTRNLQGAVPSRCFHMQCHFNVSNECHSLGNVSF